MCVLCVPLLFFEFCHHFALRCVCGTLPFFCFFQHVFYLCLCVVRVPLRFVCAVFTFFLRFILFPTSQQEIRCGRQIAFLFFGVLHSSEKSPLRPAPDCFGNFPVSTLGVKSRICFLRRAAAKPRPCAVEDFSTSDPGTVPVMDRHGHGRSSTDDAKMHPNSKQQRSDNHELQDGMRSEILQLPADKRLRSTERRVGSAR